MRFVTLLLAALAAVALLSAPVASQENQFVDVIEVTGVIDPPTSDFLEQALDRAQRDGAHAAVIQLDTPGGLDVSMRDINQQILSSEIPVVVWVAPRGARAASAGTFIAYAAHLAYMAQATELGAATPINLGGEQPEALDKKIINDAVAYIQSLAEQRGRNAEFAEEAVREGASLPATEAAEENVVTGVASSMRDLLQAMDGERVEVVGDTGYTLETWDHALGAPSVGIRFQEMNLFQRILHVVTNPEIAFLLLTIGTLGIIFEIYNPGIGLAGLLGAVALLLAFYSLSVLPTNWAGVALIILGIIFFIVELQVAGVGIWTVGGTAALITGGLLLFSGASPELQLNPWVLALVVGLTLVFFASVMTAALRVRLRRPVTGQEAIVGIVGEAKTDIAPEGTVLTKGTLWRARTMETGIAAGEKVRVMASEGLVLLVEPLHEHEEEAAQP